MSLLRRFLVLSAGFFLISFATSGQRNIKQLIFSDEFTHGFDTAIWKAEVEPLSGSKVFVQDGKLVLDTRGGATVWLNKVLKGNIEIIYTRKVVMAGGSNDRLSDLNQFWMAKAPTNKSIATRSGKFEAYDSLKLYYVGMGGNDNTTTRFRKYTGTGERTLIQEYTDAQHLLQAEQAYIIRIVVKDKRVQFYVNDQCYFTCEDPQVLKEGYFGFRTTSSHHEIYNIKIYQLK